MNLVIRKSATISEAFEVVINNSLMAYYNKNLDHCLAWVKLHYKLNNDELEILRSKADAK